MEYDYPGNIRELKSIIQSSINIAEEKPITVSCLPGPLQQFSSNKNTKKIKK